MWNPEINQLIRQAQHNVEKAMRASIYPVYVVQPFKLGGNQEILVPSNFDGLKFLDVRNQESMDKFRGRKLNHVYGFGLN